MVLKGVVKVYENEIKTPRPNHLKSTLIHFLRVIKNKS